jgi:hypothetical protein
MERGVNLPLQRGWYVARSAEGAFRTVFLVPETLRVYVLDAADALPAEGWTLWQPLLEPPAQEDTAGI